MFNEFILINLSAKQQVSDHEIFTEMLIMLVVSTYISSS